MNAPLTKLEEDLLGDMDSDAHNLYEIYAFVRLHHGEQPDEALHAIGRYLLSTWIARGWLTIVGEEASDVRLDDIAEVLTLVGDHPLIDRQWSGSNVWLWLTDQAAADVNWLGQKASPK